MQGAKIYKNTFFITPESIDSIISFLVTDIIVYVKMHFNIPKVKMHKKIFASYI